MLKPTVDRDSLRFVMAVNNVGTSDLDSKVALKNYLIHKQRQNIFNNNILVFYVSLFPTDIYALLLLIPNRPLQEKRINQNCWSLCITDSKYSIPETMAVTLCSWDATHGGFLDRGLDPQILQNCKYS